MDGFQICKLIKEHPVTAGTITLILSGYGSDEYQKKACISGADGFLTKPVSKENRLAQVEHLLEY